MVATVRLRILCPSYRPEAGALLIGAVGARGRIVLRARPLRVSEAMAAELTAGGRAEERLRFAAPCAGRGCGRWSRGRCEVPARVFDEFGRRGGDEPVPRCGIRPRCRWFRQDGRDACRLCPAVLRVDPSA